MTEYFVVIFVVVGSIILISNVCFCDFWSKNARLDPPKVPSSYTTQHTSSTILPDFAATYAPLESSKTEVE